MSERKHAASLFGFYFACCTLCPNFRLGHKCEYKMVLDFRDARTTKRKNEWRMKQAEIMNFIFLKQGMLRYFLHCVRD